MRSSVCLTATSCSVTASASEYGGCSKSGYEPIFTSWKVVLNSGVSHAGFEQRLAAIRLPWSSAAENVAYSHGGPDPATLAVQEWLSSPGQRRNLAGPF